jgi:hypothetical protein
MKVTRKQLRRIIREAETAAENAALIGVESPYEVEPEEDVWAGGDNLLNPIDQSVAGGGEAVTPEQEILDVTEDTIDEIANKLYNRAKIRRIIKETIGGTSVRTQEPFIDIVMASLQAGDPHAAATAVMDSFMIDDVFTEEEDDLVDVLGGLPYDASVEQIETAADAWLQNYRSGVLRPDPELV